MASGNTGNARSCDMDVGMWGNLQNHIELKSIYGKMPFKEFFRFRLVCKEWNCLASDQEFLEESFKDPSPNLQFVVTATSINGHDHLQRLHGLLSYDISASQWTWTRLPSVHHRTVLAVEGLIYSSSYDSAEVFNTHTKVCHSLPSAEEIADGSDMESDEPYVGMTVDTSVSPYTFQIIVGNYETPTHIYDSKRNTWTIKSSEIEEAEEPGNANCAYCNDILYIRCFNLDYIVTYDVKKDIWAQFDTPEGDCGINIPRLGVWQNRLFSITADLCHNHLDHITVWELLDHSKEEWMEYTTVPKDLYSWLAYADTPGGPSMDIDIHACYCKKYILVYTWLDEEGLAERFIMCNLLTKVWERVDVPFGLRCPVKKEAAGEDF